MMRRTALLLMTLVMTAASAQEKPTNKAPSKLGSTVTAFSSNLRTMFQARQGIYWFGRERARRSLKSCIHTDSNPKSGGRYWI